MLKNYHAAKSFQKAIDVLILFAFLLWTTSCESVGTTVKPKGLLVRLEDPKTSWINSLAWAPNSKTIAVGSQDQVVRLWDTSTRQITRKLTGFGGTVVKVVWSPNSQYLATGSSEVGDTIRIWDTQNNNLVFHDSSIHDSYITGLAWSQDNQNLAVGLQSTLTKDRLDGLMIYYPFRQQLPLVLPQSDPVTAVAWAPNDSRLAFSLSPLSMGPSTVRVWNSLSGPFMEQNFIELKGHSSTITSLSWSPDGKFLVSGSSDETVKIWDTARGQEIASFIYGKNIKSVAWSPDGGNIAVGGWNTTNIIIWNVMKKQITNNFVDSDSVNTLAWSPDSTQLASGNQTGVASIWDVR